METIRLEEISDRKNEEGKPGEPRMFEIFRRLLGKWAGLSCENIGPTVEWPANLPLERMVFFSGPVEGCLVLRAPERLGEVLLEKMALNSDFQRDGFMGDVLGEFTSLYFSHLAAAFWDRPEQSMVIYLPRATDPSSWPNVKPEVAFTVLAGEIPVEIRFWAFKK